jgi:hypothetical protein
VSIRGEVRSTFDVNDGRTVITNVFGVSLNEGEMLGIEVGVLEGRKIDRVLDSPDGGTVDSWS